MLWDLLQQHQIGKAQETASRAASSVGRTEIQVAELERGIASLALACQAMWELLREHNNLNDEALFKRMQEIDLRDGIRDGRITTNNSSCPACARVNNAKRDCCVYCGAELPPPQHIFR